VRPDEKLTAFVEIRFCHCRVESKRRTIRRVKVQITLAILATLSASFALGEDFTTLKGKEYKDATITRVEPDGIVLKTKSGISKVYFAELPKDVQERFHYDPEKIAAAQREREQAALRAEREARRPADERRRELYAPTTASYLSFLFPTALVISIVVGDSCHRACCSRQATA
jgi:hypothetical protein